VPLEEQTHRSKERGCREPQLRRGVLREGQGYYGLEAYKKTMRKRKGWIKPMFTEVKQWHGEDEA